MGRQQFTMHTGLTFYTGFNHQWFTCLLTLAYENATCFGVSSCRLLSLGEGGGLLHPVCPQLASCLSRLGLYILGCLQSVGPRVQCVLVGLGACVGAARVPSLAGWGGAWIRPPDRERIHSEYPSIHKCKDPYHWFPEWILFYLQIVC